ncbi:MAG: PEP-CTERM sorting domain-containing protein [Phycisphaerales bacterium]
MNLMNRRIASLIFTVAGLAMCGPVLADLKGTATIYGFGFDTNSAAFGVSADGSTVVGRSNNQAVRWTVADGLEDLDVADSDPEQAHGVSADGSVVVGGSDFSSFRWTEDDGVEYVSAIGEAHDVSADGTVVVGYRGAWQWAEDGGTRLLTVDGVAYGVSDDGSTVVGETYDNTAFLWTEAGGIEYLGARSARDTSADGSTVVGTTYDNTAFLWTESAGLVDLGTIPGETSATALAVSGDGSIVVGAGEYNAFIYDEQNGMRSISDMLLQDYGLNVGAPGWQLNAAWGISSDGLTIVGMGWNGGGYDEGWVVKLQPMSVVPAPGAVLLGLLGLGHSACRLRRRTS